MPEDKMDSRVEEIAIAGSGQRLLYPPHEKIGIIVVNSFPSLGTLTALRFLEWVQRNPQGVISLPTGKTPEYFIKEVNRFLSGWGRKDMQEELAAGGVDPAKEPSLGKLHFVQIDEFYPINPLHHNSFYSYVNRFYLKGFGLDLRKALLINGAEIGLPGGKSLEDIWPQGGLDLSLRYRPGTTSLERTQKKVIENIDQWCGEYEERIRELGGIGFFLGGIGPDGHIGFNIRGSDLYSTTRLAAINYETQAAAALDLGGIEVTKKKLVITIGLATITFNPECVALIMAAGEDKAKIVADSLQSEQHIHYPASVLQRLSRSRFYLTTGAARLLDSRQYEIFVQVEKLTEEEIERVVINLSLERNKRIDKLTAEDFRLNSFAAALLKKLPESLEEITGKVAERLKEKIMRGARSCQGRVFLHTEPHHDDLMLGYLPFIVRNIREHSNRHYFVTLTGGFTAITNAFMLKQLKKLKRYLNSESFCRLSRAGYFDPGNIAFRDRDVWQYLDGVAACSEAMRDEGEQRRLVRNLICIYDERDPDNLRDRVDKLINYFQTRYPGEKDLDHIQSLKGMRREWEADCLWGYFGWNSDFVRHLRLGFYKGDIFTEEPTLNRDVPPILKLLKDIGPNTVTLALDPEASGPDTYYKALQALTEALRVYAEELPEMEILGYRNVWHRFHPSEANLFVPVSLNMFSLQHSAFMSAFISQKEASFPSYAHDGPFSELAQTIHVEQYQMLKTCLGREYFYEHPSALIRATRGMVFLKRMSLSELRHLSRELRRSTENL